MADEKQTVDSSTSQQSTQESTSVQQATPTEMESSLNEQLFGNVSEELSGQAGLTQTTQELLNNLLSGGFNASSPFGELFTGIDDDMATQLAGEAVSDIMPKFQQAGVLDSGVAANVAGNVAGDIRRQVTESNLDRLYNLLNLGVSGSQAQQSLGTNQALGLGSQLSGLRTVTGEQTGDYSSTGTGTQTTTSMNPFLKSFQTSLGKTLGSPTFSPFDAISFGG